MRTLRSSKRIVIIGGGIGGLTTALLLSHRGYDVSVLERSASWGGRLRFVTCAGDRIDAGPTIVLLPEELRRILRLGGLEETAWHLHPCDPMITMHFADGSQLVKWNDRTRMLAELRQFSPGADEAFLRYERVMSERFRWGTEHVLDRTFASFGQPHSWKHTIKDMTSLFASLLRLRAIRSVRSDVGHFFRDPRLQDAFSLQSLYIGGNPWTTPAVYSLVGFAEHEFGISYVHGGYASLVPLIVDTLTTRGVRLLSEHPVERIAIDSGGNVHGVHTSSGFEPCDAVVYNGELPRLATLLPDVCGQPLRRRQWQPSSGCFLLYLGIEGTYPERTLHEFWLCADFARHMRSVFKTGTLPLNPAIYTFYPSCIDQTLTADPQHSVLYVLVPVPTQSLLFPTADSETAWVQTILQTLEQRGFPRLRNRIRWMRTYTPQDAAADGLWQGGSFGLAPSWSQSAMFRPQIAPLPHVGGLYAVGASVHPGGGIPIVMKGVEVLVRTVFSN